MKEVKNYILISCAVLARESYYCAAVSENIIDIIMVDQGLHDIGEEGMVAELQKYVDSVDIEKYDAILMGYGLCNNGIRGLHAEIPMVIPRAHDCITLLMGSKERYRDYFDKKPGTFYKSTGWVERVKHNLANPDSTTRKLGMETYNEYVEKYGEENAAYLMETLEGGLNHYDRLTYIDTGVGDFSQYKIDEKSVADERAWIFEEYHGSNSLLLALVNGNWNKKDFLVLQPGEVIMPTHDNNIIKSEKIDKEKLKK
jgi:hypothetical protein